jgi:hypothetical protein
MELLSLGEGSIFYSSQSCYMGSVQQRETLALGRMSWDSNKSDETLSSYGDSWEEGGKGGTGLRKAVEAISPPQHSKGALEEEWEDEEFGFGGAEVKMPERPPAEVGDIRSLMKVIWAGHRCLRVGGYSVERDW